MTASLYPSLIIATSILIATALLAGVIIIIFNLHEGAQPMINPEAGDDSDTDDDSD